MGETCSMTAPYEVDPPRRPGRDTVREHTVKAVGIYLPHKLFIGKESELFSSGAEEGVYEADHEHWVRPLPLVGIK